MDIVALARPQQGAMGAKCNGRVVMIYRFVRNFDPFHKWGGKSCRLNNQCAVKCRESPVGEIRKARPRSPSRSRWIYYLEPSRIDTARVQRGRGRERRRGHATPDAPERIDH